MDSTVNLADSATLLLNIALEIGPSIDGSYAHDPAQLDGLGLDEAVVELRSGVGRPPRVHSPLPCG